MKAALVIFALVVTAVAAFDNTSPAQFYAWLSAVPGVTTDARGVCVGRYDSTNMNFNLICHHNITGDTVTAAHIHGPTTSPNSASVGVLIGGASFDVTSYGMNSVFSATAAVTIPQACGIFNTQTYVNIHTAAHGAGAIRGVFMPVGGANGVTHTATLDNVQASNGTTVKTSGVALITLSNGILWTSLFHSLATSTAAHYHQAPAGSSGNPVITICSPCTPVDQYLVNAQYAVSTYTSALNSGGLYLNVHTAANPGGAIRGQVQAVAAATGPTAAQCGNDAAGVKASMFLVALFAAITLALSQ